MKDDPTHLSRISTEWDLVFRAHDGPPDVISEAQSKLMNRYSGAVHRYLLAATRDPELASELNQEFALRFLRGDLHRADPSRGRFRDFVKRALRNMMIDHYRRRKRRRASTRSLDAANLPEPAVEDGPPDFERQFTDSWRSELLAQAWRSLAMVQRKTEQPLFTVLQFRVRNPDMKSPVMAAELSKILGREVSSSWVRQALLRARDQLIGGLLDAIRLSLDDPNRDELIEELAELGLLEFCRVGLRRRGLIE